MKFAPFSFLSVCLFLLASLFPPAYLSAQTAAVSLPSIHRTFEVPGGGKEVKVEIVITTPTPVTGFARYAETLKEGDSATMKANGGSSARFVDGQTKFVWTSYPGDKEVHISYILHVKDMLVTNYPGKFSYIGDGHVQTVELPRENSSVIGQ
jgi:hypothetical protein